MWLRVVAALTLALFLPGSLRAAQPAADAMLVAWADLQTLAPDERRCTRYLWVSDADPKARWQTWSAAAGWINALSLSGRVVSPPLVLLREGKPSVASFEQMGPVDWGSLVLLRVNLHDYHQTPQQWEKLGNPSLEPLFHQWLLVKYAGGGSAWVPAVAPWLLSPLGAKDTKPYREAVDGLIRETGYSAVPVVEARNFVWQTAIDFDRKAGYYGWLGIKDKATFDRLVRLDKTLLPLREAVEESGVAAEARALERFGRGDGYWITYDQVNQRAQDHRNPVLQTDRRRFLFDASEVFGRLDNGFWALGLFDAKGKAQQSAPDGVGYNHRTLSNDGKIHVGYVCLACHDAQAGRGGLHPFDPYFRNLFATPGPLAAGAFKQKALGEFAEQYLTPLDPWADIDKRIYAAAVLQATGTTPDVFAANLRATFHSWDRHLTLEEAAGEHGVTVEQYTASLQQAIVGQGFLDNVTANGLTPKQRRSKTARNAFSEVFYKVELNLRGLKEWPHDLKQQLRPWKGKR